MKTTYDHGMILKLYDAGSTEEEIAEKMGCRVQTIQKVLVDNGRRRKSQKAGFLCPIYPAEIDRYRKRLQVGQKKRITVREYDENFCLREKEETCVVVEKYKHIFVAQNPVGKMRLVRYVDMVIRDRGQRRT